MCVICLTLVAAGMFYANITAHWSRIEFLTVLGIFCLALVARHYWVVLRVAECGLVAQVVQKPQARQSANHRPTCGYDRTGLDDGAVCPECGTPTERKA